MSGVDDWSRRAIIGGALALAALPAKARRFMPPEPAAWGMVDLDQLKAFGPACPQPSDHYTPQDEDCLFLNIWAPGSRPVRPRPVMVYIHGGAYSSGSVTDPLNDGAKLAEHGDVVVVTVNHRLHALGYLYLPDRFPDSGNNGQLDLILALQWIQRNIASSGAILTTSRCLASRAAEPRSRP